MAVSDGILEVMSESSLDDKEARLLSWVEQGELTVENLKMLLNFQDGKEIPDDITLLTLSKAK